MSERRSIQSLFMQSMEFARPSEREKWRKAIQTGDLSTVRKFMDREGFSPNVPTTITGEAPLKTLLLADKDSSVFPHQQTLAGVLIAKGAELRVPDKFNMFAADWAMLSGNRETAYRVVKETIQQFHESLKAPYKPFVDPFFATCTDRNQRNRRFDNYYLNHRYIGQCLTDDSLNGSPGATNGYENYLSDEERTYWSRPLRRTQSDMPYYTVDLIRAEKTKTQEVALAMAGVPLSHHNDWKLDIEIAHDRLYCAQLTRLRELQEERRAMNLDWR